MAVCDRIPQYIVKYPGKLIRVPVYDQVILHVHLTGQTLLLQNPVQLVRQLLQHKRQVDLHRFQLNILEIIPGDIEKFIDQFS